MLFFANGIICHGDDHLIFAFICVKEGNSLKPWPNGRKGTKVELALRLTLVAKRTQKFPHKHTQVAK